MPHRQLSVAGPVREHRLHARCAGRPRLCEGIRRKQDLARLVNPKTEGNVGVATRLHLGPYGGVKVTAEIGSEVPSLRVRKEEPLRLSAARGINVALETCSTPGAQCRWRVAEDASYQLLRLISLAPHVPLEALRHSMPADLSQAFGPVVMFCRSGARSRQAAALLRARGHTQVWHLEGGVALAEMA